MIEVSFLILHEKQEKQSQRRTQVSRYTEAEVNERFFHCSALHKGNQTVTANHIHFASAADNGVAVGAVHTAISSFNSAETAITSGQNIILLLFGIYPPVWRHKSSPLVGATVSKRKEVILRKILCQFQKR